ncbi:MAG: DUF882 domain-containing protein [Myxococcota bacterium]|nr:DUF882 domain-containing protein [Myxococcota bacterium]
MPQQGKPAPAPSSDEGETAGASSASPQESAVEADAPPKESTTAAAPAPVKAAPAQRRKRARPTGPCRRGIHKGRRRCEIQRGMIKISNSHTRKRYHGPIINLEKRSILPEARRALLEIFGDWRTGKQCPRGYTFNLEYKGGPSWRMYKCCVQDRLLWYVYLIGHHFDSRIQVISGLRSNERKSSRHHNGHAVDLKVVGVRAKEVWDFAKRSFPLVGIGYYPRGNFIHLDVGRDHHQAFWVDSSGRGENADYRSGVSQQQRGRARKSQAGMIAAIKRRLKKHHQRFKVQRTGWLKRQEKRRRAKRRRAKQRRAKQRRAKQRRERKRRRRGKRRRRD